MGARIINGKEFAAKMCGLVAEHITRSKTGHGITRNLTVVLAGEDPAGQVYVLS